MAGLRRPRRLGTSEGSSIAPSTRQFLTDVSASALIASLTKPYGVGTVFSDISGDAQLTLDVAAGTIKRGSGTVTNGQTYSRKIRARDAGSTRAVEETLTFTALAPTSSATVPAAPTIGTVTAAPGGFTVTWANNADGGSTITGNRVLTRTSGGGAYTAIAPDTAPDGSQTFTGFTAGAVLDVVVQTINAVGASANSALRTVTVEATLPALPTAAALLAEATFMLDPRALATAFGGSYAYDAEVTGSWVDSASSAAIPAGKTSTGSFPVLKQDTFGAGHPGLLMNGNNFFNIGRTPAFINALAKLGTVGEGYTIIVEANVGVTGTGNFRTLWSPDANNSGFAMRCGTATFGVGDQGSGLPGRPKSGYQLVMLRANSLSAGGWAHEFRDLVSKGQATSVAVGHATLGYLYGRGQSADGGSSGFIGHLGRMWVIPRSITTTEWVIIQKSLRDQAGLAYPWTQAHAVYGDSNTASGSSWWHQTLEGLGVSMDNRLNLAVSGLTANSVLEAIPRDCDRLAEALGVPLMCSYALYGNDTSVSSALTILTGIRAGKPTGLLVATPCDYDNSINSEAQRNTWTAAVDSSGLADLRTREDLDVRIGVEGANVAPLTPYWTDVRHLNANGHAVRAECDIPYYKRWLHDILGTPDVAAPTFPTAPVVTGAHQVGQADTTTFGVATDAGIVTQIDWLRDGGAGPVAVLPKLWDYVPVSADVTKNLAAKVYRRGPAGTVNSTSAAVGPVIA